MYVDESERNLNKYNAETESDLITLRQVYMTLSDSRKKLLEKLLKKLIVAKHLLGATLPSGWFNVIAMDFDNFRSKIDKRIHDSPEAYAPELADIFAAKSIYFILPHVYFAVHAWNRGELYAPVQPALWRDDPNYPVTKQISKLPPIQKIKRLIAMLNEPLEITDDVLISSGPRDEDDPLQALSDNSD